MTGQGLPVGLGDTLSRAGGFNSGRWCWRRPLSCTRSRACPWASAAAGVGDLGPICRRTRSKGWPWGWGHRPELQARSIRRTASMACPWAGGAGAGLVIAAQAVGAPVEGLAVGLGARVRGLGAPAQAGGAGAGPSCRRGRSGPPGRGLARGAGAPGRKLGTAAQAGGAGAGLSCRRRPELQARPIRSRSRAGPLGWGRWRQGWRSRPELQTHQVEGRPVGLGAPCRDPAAPAQAGGAGVGPSCRRGRSSAPGQGLSRGAC